MRLTRKQLHSIGTALYGEEWKTSLSRVIGVSDRTMRRYALSGVVLRDYQVDQIRRTMLVRIDALIAQANFLRNGAIDDD